MEGTYFKTGRILEGNVFLEKKEHIFGSDRIFGEELIFVEDRILIRRETYFQKGNVVFGEEPISEGERIFR